MKTYVRRESTVNKKVKDTVFTNLFKDPFYATQLVEALHPEFAPLAKEDLELITIERVLANGIYNDLAIKCFDKLMLFVEQQSTYNPNIAARLMMYAVETIKNKVVEDWDINLFSSKKAVFPNVEFFCICSYERKENYPDYEYFGEEEDYLHAKVKMIYADSKEKDIIGQYVNFSKGATCIMKAEDGKQQTMDKMKEYISKCIENGILSDYLSKHQGEVMKIMDVLFNQEFVTERMIIEARNEALAQGIAEGKSEGLIKGMEEGLAQGKAEGLVQGKAEGLVQGKAEGLVQGKTEGLAQGKIDGQLNAYIQATKTIMAKQNMSFEQTVALLDIPKDMIEKIRDAISNKQ